MELTKGHKTVEMYIELQVLYSTYCLMMICRYINFPEVPAMILKLLSGHESHRKPYMGMANILIFDPYPMNKLSLPYPTGLRM